MIFFAASNARLRETETGRILLTVSSARVHMVLRFKHVNKKLETANYPTQHSLAYDDQQPNLPYIPEGSRITIGYLLNDDETKLVAIYVICAIGRRIQWEYTIWEAGEQHKPAEIISLISEPKRVRPKTNVTAVKAVRAKRTPKRE
jgi:hypothetical protein